MAARTLVQALEGVAFPCDRAQLIDYARRNNLASRTLAALEEIPERQYRDLSEVFTALPGRPRQVTEAPQAAQAAEEPPEESPGKEGAPELELPVPLEWWLQSWQQTVLPWEVASHCLRSSAEVWPQWIRLGQRLMFPWSK